ncbi:MAG: valine--tRNA ligase, partial [Mycoplasma sp.]|nr:valine--tRNA ligase [Mycoplasma sp.]
MSNNFYNHLLIEKQVFKKWIELDLFSLPKENKDIFTILLPPPNITGKLHLGHALDGYIPDTLFRYQKLKNKNPYIIAGIDHAGISMQAKVEQWLLELKIDKKSLTNNEFLEYCYKWKENNWNYIIEQWQTIGLSFDYQNINFTLDKEHIDVVQDVFIKMYQDGLIYKAKKPVYWDTKLQTVISNIEVDNVSRQSKMYYVKYNVLDSNEYIVVATTRPETIFSDVAIAIAKNHTQYKHLVNKKVVNPLNQKIIPIIESDYVDPSFGTGAMKVSAHAFDDFQIINKHKLEIVESIDKNGLMNENTFVKGLHYLEVRNNISSYLKDALIKVESITSNVSISTRSYEPVEILVLDQWFIKMDNLASLVLESLKKQEVTFFPKRFRKTLETWMENVHDWNISRQLQWGHQIPIWYKNDRIIASKTLPSDGFVQDKDVLDTWFSSALCPFSFNHKIIGRPYPIDFLSTGYDIIFFWVARMYFQSLYYKKQIPFKQVFLHGIIRDENNLKMSKSLNNGIDPIEIIEKYGSDALRFFLLGNTTAGLDLRFNNEKLIASSRLVNKLWNIYQFIENTMVKNDLNQANEIDQWIINQIFNLEKEIDKLMEFYNWVVICSKIYHFIFDVFSKWYVEFLKE